VLQLPPVSNEQELREAVLGLGLNERDVPGIAQLFGHPTTLLELEPPVRRREMVWSALRALERAALQGPVTVVCEDVDRFDHPSLEILRRAAEVTDLALPPIVMTSTVAFGAQWPAALPRLELGALEAADLTEIVGRLDRAGVPTSRRVAEKHDRPGGRIERVAVQLERGAAGEHDVHLLVTERLLRMALDHLVARRIGGVGVHTEGLDSQGAADRPPAQAAGHGDRLHVRDAQTAPRLVHPLDATGTVPPHPVSKTRAGSRPPEEGTLVARTMT